MEGAASTEHDVSGSPDSEGNENGVDIVKDDGGEELFEGMNLVGVCDGNDSRLDENHGDCDGNKYVREGCIVESGGRVEILDENLGLDGLGKMEKSGELEDESLAGLHIGVVQRVDFGNGSDDGGDLEVRVEKGTDRGLEEIPGKEKELASFSDGTEFPGIEDSRRSAFHSSDNESEGKVWPGKAVALTNFVKLNGMVAVTSFLRVLSGKRFEVRNLPSDENGEGSDSANGCEAVEASPRPVDRLARNPLNYVMMSREGNKDEEALKESGQPIVTKGRVLLYTRFECQNCREVRLFLRKKGLRYFEINIDVYPSRKMELEKFTGSSAVPKLFFNEVVIGGLNELKGLDESGKLQEKIDYIETEAPPKEAPLPPLSGEDDPSCSSSFDELALIARKMKDSIVIKDRFYKMRRFVNCFLGSEAVDFLSEDQYLEREEAVEFGRKLASKMFFRHVLEENLFEDSNHLYRFLDDDPAVSSQCYNIPRGIIEAKPKPITEIASRLRFISCAILEAYTSQYGKHVDYRSVHGSEEFARYLRIIQELHRVEILDMSREEKLAFFINLYNMMAIHGILVFGYPVGTLERQKLFGDFKYVIGGCIYSLSDLQHGILRGNQQPPHNLKKPFDVKDKRCKVALPYPEPLIHFALVHGTQSGPALRCFSPGNIDEELTEAARSFLRGGGLIVDLNAKVAYVNKILKWFGLDFGKNEVEVLKHASIYLEPTFSAALLELLADSQLKVIYQPYDWGLNC